MEVLLIGQADSIFFEHYTKTIKRLRPDINFDIFSIDNISGKYDLYSCHDIYINTWGNSFVKNIKGLRTIVHPFYTWFSLYKFLKQRGKKYDIIHFKWLVPGVVLFPNTIAKFAVKTIATFWGQEYKRDKIFFSNKLYKRVLYGFLKNVDAVINHSKSTNEYVGNVLGSTDKFHFARYGSSIIKEIDKLESNEESKIVSKKKLNFDPNKISVAIGYSGKEIHQHIKVVSELFGSEDFKENADKFLFVFPMSYGCYDQYIQKVESEIRQYTQNYKILNPQKYTDEEMARYRNATDIMIQLSTYDGLSASIIETFYAGTIIISGTWLPYEAFRESNMFYYELDKIDQQLPDLLINLSENINNELEVCKQNKGKWDYDSWEKVIPNWINIYEEVLNKAN